MTKKIFLLLILLSSSLFAAPLDPSLLLKKIETSLEMTTDIKANVVLTQQKVEQGIKVIEMIYYRRDSDDSFLIVMSAPEAEKGNGYLRTGDNLWMYRRNTRMFQHINRDESIGGSDAKADDFESRKLTETYEFAKDENGKEIISQEMLGKIPVHKIEIKAKVNDVDYPRKIYWIRRDNYLPLKEEAYSLSDTLMQTAYYIKYTIVDGRYVPIKQMFIDEFEKGNKTMVEISNISTKKLADSIFTKAYLENLSK